MLAKNAFLFSYSAAVFPPQLSLCGCFSFIRSLLISNIQRCPNCSKFQTASSLGTQEAKCEVDRMNGIQRQKLNYLLKDRFTIFQVYNNSQLPILTLKQVILAVIIPPVKRSPLIYDLSGK